MRTATIFAFDNGINSVSDQIPTDNVIAVFHIIDKLGEEYTQLSEVESSIRRSLSRDKKKEYAKNLLDNLDDDNNWETLSDKSEYLDYSSNETSTIGGSFKTFGRSNELQGILVTMKAGNVSNILESSSHIFIVNLIEKDSFVEEKFIMEKDSIRTQLLSSKRNQTYNNWLRAEKKNIEIVDLRHKIF